jgi:endonuclease/exonuclease/phosphatase (EEP) superfamily protein YafD
MIIFLTYLFAAITTTATILPLIRSELWWVRIMDFPRSQIISLILLDLCLAAFLYLNKMATIELRLAATVQFGCLLYQLSRIFPYTALSPKQVGTSRARGNEDNHISLLICNVLKDNHHSDGIIHQVKKMRPDLFLAVETDQWWKDQLDTLIQSFPYTVSVPLDNTYGMLLYSRLPLEDAAVKFLVQPDVPSVHTTVVLPSGQRVRFYGLHPRPPAPQEADSSLPRDKELIISGKMVRDSLVPSIIAGDMNDVAWSHTTGLFQKIGHTLDPRRGRGMYNTFHAEYFFLRWPLDHIFHTNHFRLVSIQRLPYIGSDHFPMYVKLSFEADAACEQAKPIADHEEKLEVREKLDKNENEESSQV